ncbi:hypothetical protein FJ942_17040 [Mesorhizobium sp. B2-4-2]|uniref:hypothetical protein n=1 Tax=Mesorhizobium sp. B2-4-2 TaxID=2589947 RepID=UPI001126AE4C|nr:hypothetical protein [Mesorhizobium sp. B2-4-2]TPL55411.1 hypothetical protein FJ942_17040 [Mesorhizobium sp. B2-4-2]
MTSRTTPRITLDTNACDIIHDPDKRPEIMPPADARRLRQSIADGEVLAFVSEATLFVECLGFADKLAYLAVAGTRNPRPVPDPRRAAVFVDLASIGIKLLHAPLIGAEIFIPDMEWAQDVVYSQSDRQGRFFAFCRNYPRHEPLITLGNSLLAGQPPVPAGRTISQGPTSLGVEIPQGWAIAIKREWDNADEAGRKKLRRQVGPIIGEWCDTLIVGSHVGYGNDIFCTADEGKGAGSNSLLFHGNRANLNQQGITIMSPVEVLRAIS